MAITLVTSNSEQTAANFASPMTAFNCAAGNLIIFGARYGWDGVHVISGITDTASNSYGRIGASIGPTSNINHAELWYAWNSNSNATNAIQASIGGGTAANCWFGHLQYSGILNSSDPLDQNANGTVGGSASSVTTGTYTTTQVNELLVNMATVNAVGDTFTPPTGFAQRAQDALAVLTFFDKIVASIQTGATDTVGSNNARSWITISATFKAAVSLNIKTVDGIVIANIKKIDSIDIANIKTINGV